MLANVILIALKIMATREAVKKIVRQVKPILSVDRGEARKRVFNLYKAWYRQIPYVGMYVIFFNVLFIFIPVCSSLEVIM